MTRMVGVKAAEGAGRYWVYTRGESQKCYGKRIQVVEYLFLESRNGD